MAPAGSVTVVVPTLDEAERVGALLRELQPARAAGHEVIVVDGGSGDGTPARARPWADRVLGAPRGRAGQMNAGARAAAGDVLLFLHADTRLPPDGVALLRAALDATGRGWGRFDVRLSGRHWLLRIVERMISWRSRLTGVATGDQAIFVRRSWFEAAGGFPEIPLMEDVALSRRLRRRGRPACLRATVVTSSRRWEAGGILRTVALMWGLRLGFYLGVPVERLAARYR